MGPRINALAPRTEEITVLVEDDYGMLSSVEYVDVVLGVHAHCGAFLEGPAVGELPPTILYFIGVRT